MPNKCIRLNAEEREFLERFRLAKKGADLSDFPDGSAFSDLPDGIEEVSAPVHVHGTTAIFSDVHLPFHCKQSIIAAVSKAKRENVETIILNGDIIDAGAISRHPKDQFTPAFCEEIELLRRFLSMLRAEFPSTRIIYKIGNHDERLERYIYHNAEAIAKLVTLERLIDAEKYGVQMVASKQFVKHGDITIIHGHEINLSGGVYPARSLFFRTRSNTIAGHLHKRSTYETNAIGGGQIRCDVTGTLGKIRRGYMPHSDACNGFAIIKTGGEVLNYKIENGTVL